MRNRIGHLAAAVLSVGISIGSIARAQSPTTNSSDQAPPAPPSLSVPTTVPLLQQPTTSVVLPQAVTPSTQPVSETTPALQSNPASVATQQRGNTLTTPDELGKVVVTSDLDVARSQIAPSLGATTYTQGPAQIQSIPGGDNASFQQVLIRAPGVVEDSFGQEHVRGEHANLTYRVNGVLLPEPLNGFGQELDTRLIDSVTLIDGSLPAQFGFHTAGIVDVTTKSGETLDHNEVSVYGGSYDTIQPSVQFGGSSGKFDYFFVVSENHNDLGIENPTGTHRALHDYTNQQKFFTYLAYRPDDTSRLSLLANASYADFEIPNTAGVTPDFALANSPGGDSSKINENQNEQEYYTVLSYQKTAGNLSLQVSGFSRYGQITFDPDQQRDLIFQGVAGGVYNNFVTNGIQLDSSYILNDQHTLRSGALTDYTYEKLNTNTSVFSVNAATGNQASDVPFAITDNSSNHAQETGLYLQDEYRITPKVTLNYGLRYDRFDANFDTEDQVSPRVNVVYKLDDATTTHFGYARYFVTPPVQNVEIGSVRKFAGTTNAPDNFLADQPKVERSHYFDGGISHQITKEWEIGLDGFYKLADNLIDLGQFGEAVILSPFNYKVGTVYGGELSSTYKQGGLSLFANSGWVETRAHDIDSQQFQIDNAELAYISKNDIHLDHEAEFAGSAGAAYQWRNDAVYVDFLYATGLRDGFANTGQVQPHYPVNVGYQHIFRLAGMDKNPIKFRADVVNIFDEKYEIRDGSGIGVGAPQYGQRLSFFAGLSYEF